MKSKTNNTSSVTVFRKSPEFKSTTRRQLQKPSVPDKTRKKKVAMNSRRFFDEEVAISQESALDISSDEVETSLDLYETSFIDNSSHPNTDK